MCVEANRKKGTSWVQKKSLCCPHYSFYTHFYYNIGIHLKKKLSDVLDSGLCTSSELWSVTHTMNLYTFVYMILINQPKGLKDNETETSGYLITFCPCVQQTLLNSKLQQVIILISQRLVASRPEHCVICRRLEHRWIHLTVQ